MLQPSSLTKEAALHHWEIGRFLNHKYDAQKGLIRAFLDILTKQLFSQPKKCTAEQPESFWGRKPWLVDAGDTKSKSTPKQQTYRKKGKASRYCKVHSCFFSQFYLTVILVVKAVGQQTWEEKGNPILREKYTLPIELLSVLKSVKGYSDNRAGVGTTLWANSGELHGFKEDPTCATWQSTAHLEARGEFWKHQLRVC